MEVTGVEGMVGVEEVRGEMAVQEEEKVGVA